MFIQRNAFARVSSNRQNYTLQSQKNGLYRTLLRQCACRLSRYELRKRTQHRRTRHRRTILGSFSTAAGQTKPHPLHLWRRRCRPRNRTSILKQQRLVPLGGTIYFHIQQCIRYNTSRCTTRRNNYKVSVWLTTGIRKFLDTARYGSSR